MFWTDGLIPSYRHFGLDLLSLFYAGWFLNTSTLQSISHASFLLALNIVTRGGDQNFRNRWPITFPLLGIMALEIFGFSLNYVLTNTFDKVPWLETLKGWGRVLCLVLQNLLLLMSVVLCGLFPVVKLPSPKGPYAIGVLEDLCIPVNWKAAAAKIQAVQPKNCQDSSLLGKHEYMQHQNHVSARLFYPTSQKLVASTYYIHPTFATDLCNSVMSHAAPSPLNKFGFLLYNWKLVSIPAQPNASLLNQDKPIPLVVYSHGLFGTPHMYTKQALDLAANGYMVLMIHHRDGSAPYIKLQGEANRQYQEFKHWLEGPIREQLTKLSDATLFVRCRRDQTVFRATEMLAVTQALLEANSRQSGICPSLETLFNLSKTAIDTTRITFMGHSFGGATAMTATSIALYHFSTNPSSQTWSPSAIVAHEPANDWSPDFTRYTLYDNNLLEASGSDITYEGGTGGYVLGDETLIRNLLTSSVRTIHSVPTLVLYSTQWASQGWGGSKFLHDISKSQKLIKVHTIPHAYHQEFSDTCSLIPLWIGRMTRQIAPKADSGGKNPVDNLEVIWNHTYHDFLKPLHTLK